MERPNDDGIRVACGDDIQESADFARGEELLDIEVDRAPATQDVEEGLDGIDTANLACGPVSKVVTSKVRDRVVVGEEPPIGGHGDIELDHVGALSHSLLDSLAGILADARRPGPAMTDYERDVSHRLLPHEGPDGVLPLRPTFAVAIFAWPLTCDTRS